MKLKDIRSVIRKKSCPVDLIMTQGVTTVTVTVLWALSTRGWHKLNSTPERLQCRPTDGALAAAAVALLTWCSGYANCEAIIFWLWKCVSFLFFKLYFSLQQYCMLVQSQLVFKDIGAVSSLSRLSHGKKGWWWTYLVVVSSKEVIIGDGKNSPPQLSHM